MTPSILATLRLTPQGQGIVSELAAPLGGATFLADVPEAQRIEAIQRAEVLLCFHPARELRDDLEHLRAGQFLQMTSAGLDHLPFDRIAESVKVAGNSGAFARPMSEHALGMILCLAKRLREEDAAMRRGEFNQMAPNMLLWGKKAAVLGLGGVGKLLAGYLRCLGMEVFAVNTTGRTSEPVSFIGDLGRLDQVLADAQVVALTLPLTWRTRHLIGERELSLMARNAILVNVARGELLDQGALYRHLRANPYFRAGIESWWVEPVRDGRFELEHPLLEQGNLLACPHNAFNTPEWERLGLESAFANIRRHLAGDPVTGQLSRYWHRL